MIGFYLKWVHVGVRLINAIKNCVSGWKASEKTQEAVEDCLAGWVERGTRKKQES